MVKLLDDGENILTQVKSTDAITAGSVIKLAKKQADELSTTIGKTVLPNKPTSLMNVGNTANKLSPVLASVDTWTIHKNYIT